MKVQTDMGKAGIRCSWGQVTNIRRHEQLASIHHHRDLDSPSRHSIDAIELSPPSEWFGRSTPGTEELVHRGERQISVFHVREGSISISEETG